MKTIIIRNGLDIPVAGSPSQLIRPGTAVRQVALVGDDYIGLKPTMLVGEGDKVLLGQPLFTDKKNPGYNFTAPGCGRVLAINRGAKRKFESLVIELDGDGQVVFDDLDVKEVGTLSGSDIRRILQDSGLWTGLRTRPYGKVPAAGAQPASLFVTAIDTNPLAPDPQVVLAEREEAFRLGLEILQRMLSVPIHLCVGSTVDMADTLPSAVQPWLFQGPHPAGLPSTHIHFIDPVHESKEVWHICYQDVVAIGHLFATGRLLIERIIGLGGPGIQQPGLVRTRLGASLADLCRDEEEQAVANRLVSGSVLDGRVFNERTGYLGRYHRQVSIIREGSGRSFFGWLMPGGDRFSATRLFASAFSGGRKQIPFSNAAWGGRRAIFPLGTYEKVMPLDIVATSLLKSLSVGDTEKSAALGCLELIEEDLALCSFVCPGKNEFGPMLRDVLSIIEKEG